MTSESPNAVGQAGGRSARKEHAVQLFAGLPDHYDRMGSLLSFGQDPRWRRAMVAAVAPSPGERVLDVATGTGLVAVELVRRYGCSVVALDQSAEMLAGARRRVAAEPGLEDRIELVQGEAERLPFGDGEFDSLTFTYLLRYVDDPAATMQELARVVRTGGTVASVEFAVPGHPVPRALWRAYTSFGLPVLGRLVSREWQEVGRFLATSIPQFYERYPMPRLREMWSQAGIDSVEVRPMSFGAGAVMWGVRGGG